MPNDLKFNAENFTKYIFAGEIPPNRMFELLTTEWGLGENLALAMIDIYGGHIWNAFNAIHELKRHASRMQSDDFGLSLALNAALKCVKSGDDNLTSSLKELAKTGFCPSDEIDSLVAQEISKCNLGEVAKRGSYSMGFDESLWKGKNHRVKFGLIPSRHAVRLAIADIFVLKNF